MSKINSNNVNTNQGNNNGTKIVCPHCGGAIWLPNHQHEVNGIAIGRDSNLGTVVLRPDGPVVAPVSEPTTPGFACAANQSTNTPKAESRLDILNRAGIDTSDYVSLINKNGEERIAKKSGNAFVELSGDELDKVEEIIRKSGYIANRRLWRRWIMAQVFHGLNSRGGFTDFIRRKGYMYQFSVINDELRTLALLWKKDKECWEERNVFFTKDAVLGFAYDHLDKVIKYCGKLRVRKCKGIPYVKVRGKNVFVNDLEKVINKPLRDAITRMETSATPDDLYNAYLSFERASVKLKWETTFAPSFMDAYKGSGAYYTLKNLIMFHGCKLRDGRGRFTTIDGSLALLKAKVYEYRYEYWRLLALLKDVITYNKYNFEADMKARGYRK